jgi:hypothetical protein
MREFTKSLFSASWAMSLFGVQQLVNLTRPKQAAEAFDAVADAAAEGFEGITKATFEAGDRWQQQIVDATLSIFSRDALDPARLVRTTSDVLRQSADTVSQGIREATAAARPPAPQPAAAAPPPPVVRRPQGWGAPDAAGAPVTPVTPATLRVEQQGWGPMPGADVRG